MSARGNDAIVVAVIASAIVHVLLMAWVRTRVMTHVASAGAERNRRAPMQFTAAAEIQRPTSLEELLDLKPLKEAPAAVSDQPQASIGFAESDRPAATPPAPSLPAADSLPQAPRFELPAAKLSTREFHPEVLTHLETPSAPRAAAPVPTAVSEPSAGIGSAPQLAPAELGVALKPVKIAPAPEKLATEAPETPFVPSNEVLAEVDAKVVEAEKAAVRALVNSTDARELSSKVNFRTKRCDAPDGVYFELEIIPTSELKLIPKDVVVILDASGSIGSDRMGSIRKAAKRILRSATNTGDRFNLVAFRDRYAYAFRRWQECTQTAFDQSDRWLNNVAAHGRTDVFSTIESVLTLPRHPGRPLIALIVTDGDANVGVSDTAEIISRFTELNDGLISVYMYGVKSSSNRELMDGLTHGNRGESLIFDGWRWNAGEGIEPLSERFRDPVLSDLRLVPASGSVAEIYPRRLRNAYRGGTVRVLGRLPPGGDALAFSLKGLSCETSYESYFKVPLGAASADATLPARWRAERKLDFKIRKEH